MFDPKGRKGSAKVQGDLLSESLIQTLPPFLILPFTPEQAFLRSRADSYRYGTGFASYVLCLRSQVSHLKSSLPLPFHPDLLPDQPFFVEDMDIVEAVSELGQVHPEHDGG